MMKGVMYHYVRKSEPELPFFRYLHADDFEKQLDFFAQDGGILSREAFHEALKHGKPVSGYVLTFDDGVLDHYRYVYPLLKERGLWGIFYVSTGPYAQKVLLDVHRVHMLTGHLGGAALLAALQERVQPEMLIAGSERFKNTTYTHQDNDAATTQAKQLINYCVKPEYKAVLLADLMEQTFGDEAALSARFYLTHAQLQEMADNGMAIGSHAKTHNLLSHLSAEQQEEEISGSFDDLRAVCGAKLENSFCYPYGGNQSFNADTVRLLKKEQVEYAFSVEPRDIVAEDLVSRLSIPRYDCNMFPHGKSRLG